MKYFDVAYIKKDRKSFLFAPVPDPPRVDWNRKIWEYIKTYTAVKGYPPTIRQTIRGTGHINSMSVYMGRIRELEMMGRVQVSPGVARGIVAVVHE